MEKEVGKLLEAAIRGVLRFNGVELPGSEFTLAQVTGEAAQGRADVLVSSFLHRSASGNPLTMALFEVGRPFVDGLLTANIGPVPVRHLQERLETALVVRGSR